MILMPLRGWEIESAVRAWPAIFEGAICVLQLGDNDVEELVEQLRFRPRPPGPSDRDLDLANRIERVWRESKRERE